MDKNFVQIALSHTIFEINVFLHFNTEIQDGRQNCFWQKVLDDSVYVLGAKNFAESVSKQYFNFYRSHLVSQGNRSILSNCKPCVTRLNTRPTFTFLVYILQ